MLFFFIADHLYRCAACIESAVTLYEARQERHLLFDSSLANVQLHGDDGEANRYLFEEYVCHSTLVLFRRRTTIVDANGAPLFVITGWTN